MKKIEILVGHCLKAGTDVYEGDRLEVPKDLTQDHADALVRKRWARWIAAEPEQPKPEPPPVEKAESATVKHGDPEIETRDPETQGPLSRGRGRRKSGGR